MNEKDIKQIKVLAANNAVSLLGGVALAAAKVSSMTGKSLDRHHVNYWLKAGVPPKYCPAVHQLTDIPLTKLEPEISCVSVRIVAMDFYPFHVGDYRKDTIHLTPTEHYIYRTLMDWYYLDEKPIPEGNEAVIRRLRLPNDDDHANLLANVLQDFFTHEEDGWHHGRIDHELALYQSKREQASEAGKASARARKKKGTTVQRPFNGRTTDVQPTKNQEPRTSTAPDKQERTGKKTALFLPPDLSEVIEYFMTKNLNGDPAHFHDHFENCDWKLSSGRGKKMKDWKLSANNWSRSENGNGKNSRSSTGSKHSNVIDRLAAKERAGT